MHFNIEKDIGSCIQLWLVPDNPSTRPRIRVSAGMKLQTVVEARELKEGLKSSGVHETGVCGFNLTEANVPGLSSAHHLAIHDFDSGLLLYQRTGGAAYVTGRLFRLETRIVSHSHLDKGLGDSFLMSYPRLERLPIETIRSILQISYAGSIFASGRLPFGAVQGVLRKMRFKTAIMLVDPFRELFARIALVLDRATPDAAVAGLVPPAVRLRIAKAFDSVEIRDLDSVGATLLRLDPELQSYLADPLTRQLVDSDPGQALSLEDARSALRTISEFDAIGVESDPGSFFETVFAALGEIPAINIPFGSGPDSTLSDRLRNQAGFRRLTRLDAAIFGAVSDELAALPDEDGAAENVVPMISFASSSGMPGPSARD